MNNSIVTLKSKTRKRLNLNPLSEKLLIEKIANFINRENTSFMEAFQVIFSLIYNAGNDEQEEILNKFGFTSFQNDSPSYIYLNEEQIVYLGKELKYQYVKENPNFLRIDDNPAYQQELESLKKAMADHPLLLFKAVQNCKKHCTQEYVSICVEPLLSDNSCSQSYGLRKLRHNPQYRELLLPYAKEIGNLLLAMYYADKYIEEISYESFEEQSYVESSKEENEEKPCIEVVEQTDNEIPEENNSEPEEDEIQKAFDEKKRSDNEFCKRLVHLYNLGFDLNVLAKSISEDDINRISDSLQAAIQATETFYNAMDALDEALDVLDDAVGKLKSPVMESISFFVRA